MQLTNALSKSYALSKNYMHISWSNSWFKSFPTTLIIFEAFSTAWKVSVFRVFLVSIFPHSDQKNPEYGHFPCSGEFPDSFDKVFLINFTSPWLEFSVVFRQKQCKQNSFISSVTRGNRCQYTAKLFFQKDRSSHQRCSIKKGVLKNFAKFTGKHLWQRLFFKKVAGWGLQLYQKRDSGTDVFLSILRNF